MAKLPPYSLNEFVPCSSVLRFCGVETEPVIPVSVPCPFCGVNDTFHAVRDPLSCRLFEGGYWYFCSACKVAGDGFEMYKRLHGLNTMEEVRERLTDVDGLNFESVSRSGMQNYTPIPTDQYEELILGPRYEFTRFWKQAVSNMTPKFATGTNLGVFGALQLYSSAGSDWHQRLGRLVGCEFKSVIAQLPIESMKGIKFVGARAAVVPAYDVPGRLSGIWVLSKSTQKFFSFHLRKGGNASYEDDGMAFLSGLRKGLPRVYVMNDMMTALQLQRRHLDNSPYQDPLPIVVPAPEAKESLGILSCFTDEVVMWNRGGWDSDMFLTANRLDIPVYIASTPNWSEKANFEEIRSQVQSQSPTRVLAEMRDSSFPFPFLEALKDYFLCCAPTERSSLSMGLKRDGFSSNDVAELLAKVPKDKLSLVEPYFRDHNRSTGVTVYKTNFEIVKGALIIPGNGRVVKQQLCETDVQFHSRTYYRDLDETWFSGTMTSDGETIAFTERQSVIEKDFHAWVSRVCMAEGVVPGFVDRTFNSKKMLDVYLTMQTPPLITSTSRVGWDERTKSFCFPHFSIIKGKTEKKEAIQPEELKGPGWGLRSPLGMSAPDVQRLVGNSPTSECFWAILAPMLRNFLAPLYDWPVSNIGVTAIGSRNPVLDWMAKKYDLRQHKVLKADDIPTMIEAAAADDLPLFVSSETHGLDAFLQWTHTGECANVVTILPDLAGKLLLLRNTWTIVSPSSQIADTRELTRAHRSLINYLSWYQRTHEKVDTREGVLKGVARSLDKWARQQGRCMSHAIEAAVDHLVTPPSTSGHFGERFVAVIEHLIEKDSITCSSVADKTAVVIRGADSVTINYPPLDAVLKSLDCPTLPRSAINVMLVNESVSLGRDALSCTIPMALYVRWRQASA